MPYSSREAQRAYQRQWIARRKAAFFAGKACAHCAAVKDLQVALGPKAEEHRIWSWSDKRRTAALAKGRVLCRTCHGAQIAEDRYPAREHRTNTMYQKGGCRCAPCRAAHAEVQRELRARGDAL